MYSNNMPNQGYYDNNYDQNYQNVQRYDNYGDGQTQFSELAKINDQNKIIFNRNEQKCRAIFCCGPTWKVQGRIGHRDIDTNSHFYNAKPTQNCCCCKYENEIVDQDQQDVMIHTKRTCGFCTACLFVLFPCGLICYNKLKYQINLSSPQSENELGSVECPCCFEEVVKVNGVTKYKFGKSGCCKGDTEFSREFDIWNAEKTLRLGVVRHMRRIPNPICLCCCCCHNHWIVDFPQQISPEEKATIMAAAYSHYGECPYCCCTFVYPCTF